MLLNNEFLVKASTNYKVYFVSYTSMALWLTSLAGLGNPLFIL